jgi:hypothetical protein
MHEAINIEAHRLKDASAPLTHPALGDIRLPPIHASTSNMSGSYFHRVLYIQ